MDPDSATVAAGGRMELHPRREITDAIVRWMRIHVWCETDGPVDGPEDRRGLRPRLAREGDPEAAGRIATLADRYDRPKLLLATGVLETAEPVDFVADQSIDMRDDGTSRAKPVASSPTRDELERCVRRVPGRRPSLQVRDGMAVGDTVTFRAP